MSSEKLIRLELQKATLFCFLQSESLRVAAYRKHGQHCIAWYALNPFPFVLLVIYEDYSYTEGRFEFAAIY